MNGVTNVLVVGNGAREHALCHVLRRSPSVTTLSCTPGNAGTAAVAENVSASLGDVDQLVRIAQQRVADLVIVGPEAPLAAGLADRLREAGIRTFGPGQAAARIEASKAWAKDLMRGIGVPTARAVTATSHAAARRAVEQVGLPAVIKADGLAAGKGVTVALDRVAADAALDELFVRRSLGSAADVVVVEEFLEGRELSVIALCDGERLAILPPARDYKAALEGGLGPNTGGMGAFTRPSFATPGLLARLRIEILEPVVRELGRRGAPFVGALYAGLMVTASGPKVIEFNCRLGDPETQVILPLLESDLLDAMLAAADGRLDAGALRWSSDVLCGVVLTAGGYPGTYTTGDVIHGLDTLPDDIMVFHAGTRQRPEGEIVTAGGRVLTVVGRGATLEQARTRAYAGAAGISYRGVRYRADIGDERVSK
ncbi:MAG: phosphoribosylamine--glycine ligase [Chloroflexi bacterium]|nr:phosphoribosylamine--glycine ligase [Chloroflexota bacterium]